MKVKVKEIEKEGKTKYNTKYYIATIETDKKETHKCIIFKNELKVGDVIEGDLVEYVSESGETRKKFSIIKKQELLEQIYDKITTLEEKIDKLLEKKQYND